MKTELILIGKTNDKHFQAGIDDYTSRIGHYMPFTITVIPELKNTKALSEAQQKEREGEMVLAKLQSSDHVVLLDEHAPSCLRYRRSIRVLRCYVSESKREDKPVKNDFLTSDGTTRVHRTDIQGLHHYQR